MGFKERRRQVFLSEEQYQFALSSYQEVVYAPDGLLENLKKPEDPPDWHKSLMHGLGDGQFNLLLMHYAAGDPIEPLRAQLGEAVAPTGGELPRQGRHKTQAKDTVDTGRGAGSSHKAVQRTRQVFGTMAHIATGLVGEHMVDYHELKRPGGSFPHDSSHRFTTGASVAKLNCDKRPVNLSIEDLPKVPHKGIDAVWQHRGGFTVTEAKARGSLVVLEAVAANKAPKELKSLDDKTLYLLLSTSAAEEGDGKTLVQMSKEWVHDRISHERIDPAAESFIRADRCDRRIVLVTFESDGAVTHAQSLTEMELGVPAEEALAHEAHGVQKVWPKSAINNAAEFKKNRMLQRQQRSANQSSPSGKGSKPRKGP